MARIFVRDFNFDLGYARAFFVVPPDTSPLMAGETRSYPIKYDVGANDPASAFELHWYATRVDADSFMNRLTDTSRLPTATFVPETPNTGTQGLQDGAVVLTAPTANAYENPVGVIEMVQDTGEFIEPYIYLTEDVLIWEHNDNVEYRDYTFRYWIGEPAVTAFHLEWYPTRLSADLRVRELTDIDRLPRAVFMPAVPNEDAGAEEVQEGTLRLYPAVSDNPYTQVVGLLCLVQIQKREVDVNINTRETGTVFSNWRRGR